MKSSPLERGDTRRPYSSRWRLLAKGILPFVVASVAGCNVGADSQTDSQAPPRNTSIEGLPMQLVGLKASTLSYEGSIDFQGCDDASRVEKSPQTVSLILEQMNASSSTSLSDIEVSGTKCDVVTTELPEQVGINPAVQLCNSPIISGITSPLDVVPNIVGKKVWLCDEETQRWSDQGLEGSTITLNKVSSGQESGTIATYSGDVTEREYQIKILEGVKSLQDILNMPFDKYIQTKETTQTQTETFDFVEVQIVDPR